jgi:hypothetical protein
MRPDRISEDADWREGHDAFRNQTGHLINELTLMIEDLHGRVIKLESQKHNESE